jgi:chaperonin GroES
MNIQPIGNRLVIKLAKKEQTSKSGIIIATEAKDEQAIGEIVAIGKGQGSEDNITELGLQVGDKVVFGKFAGEEVETEETGTIFKIMNGKDILGILK